VVFHCLDAQVEFLRDLLGRASLLEQAQHFGLARRQVRGGVLTSSLGSPVRSPKTPTTCLPPISGTALTSSASRVPSGETNTPLASVAAVVPSTLRAKSSCARARSSGLSTDVKCLPRTLPSSRSAAGLIHERHRPYRGCNSERVRWRAPLRRRRRAGGRQPSSPCRECDRSDTACHASDTRRAPSPAPFARSWSVRNRLPRVVSRRSTGCRSESPAGSGRGRTAPTP